MLANDGRSRQGNAPTLTLPLWGRGIVKWVLTLFIAAWRRAAAHADRAPKTRWGQAAEGFTPAAYPAS